MGSDMKNENIEVGQFDPETAEKGADHGVVAHQVGWETHRGLKSRHVQLLALGGTIGTGLFVGSGTVLSLAGPAPMLMAYTIISFFIWVVMMDLGEMTCYMPVKGLSVPYLIDRFLDPSMGFAAGWNYWFALSIVTAAEVTAGTVVLKYWTESIPDAAIITIFLSVILVLNLAAVAWYGEIEFWFASIKIIAIIGLIILGIILFFGGGPTHDRLGFRYWKHPGAFNEYLVSGNTGRFLALWISLIKAAFSFILTPEFITMAAGECQAPRRNLPKATRRYIYRLLVFYVLGSLVIGVIVPYNSDRLLSAINSGASGAAASPFVIGIQNAGIPVLNHIMNAVILTSAWSAGNSYVFSASRVLYSLSRKKQAPSIFMKCNRNGVPYMAVLATFAISLLSYLNVRNSGARVFGWLASIIVVSGFIAWCVVLATYLRFRTAVKYYKIRDQLVLHSPLQPYATYITLFFISLFAITNGFSVFFPGNFTASDFLTSYISFPIFFGLYIGHKLWFRTPLYIKVDDIDLFSGLEEVEAVTAADEPPVPKNIAQKVWFWIV